MTTLDIRVATGDDADRRVDDAGRDSFPASDPPTWWAGTDRQRHTQGERPSAVPVTPIEARCRRCGDDFHLFEVRDQRRGTCPRCGWILTPDWTAKLLEDAARADIAQRHLVGALRSLRNLPGNVAVRPHTVLRNLFEEVGWQRDLAEDPVLLREELHALRRLLASWERLEPAATGPAPEPGWLRRAARAATGRSPRPAPVAA